MIKENVRKILSELPEGVMLEAACKTRRPDEILEALEAGIKIVGENYVQEAERAFAVIGRTAEWHFIGHLQKNKARRAAGLFDMIETLDSLELADALDKACKGIEKVMPVLVEINSGKEPQKFGIFPEDAEDFIKALSEFRHIKVEGLMTMGPMAGSPEEARPYFKETRALFDSIRNAGIPSIDMKYLSMGMTHSYRVAIEEGANIVRIGTGIFGPRH